MSAIEGGLFVVLVFAQVQADQSARDGAVDAVFAGNFSVDKKVAGGHSEGQDDGVFESVHSAV